MAMNRRTRKKTERIFDGAKLDADLDAVKAKIVVIIPALNEEGTISDIVTRIEKVFKKNRCQIVIIDDGSTDQTAQIARKAGAIVVEHSWNKGLAKAIKTGLNEALKRNADIILGIDADGQYQPEEMPRLLKPILDGEADIVLGSRFLGSIENMPFVKRVGNRFFTWLLRKITGFPFTDTQTGFRALTCDAAKKIPLQSRYTYTQEMLIHATEAGLRIKEVPIYFAERKQGSSRLIQNPISYGIRAFLIILRSFRDYHPLMFFGILGCLMILIGLILGSYLTISWLLYGYIDNLPLIILVLFFTVGIQLISFGFFADLVVRLHKELKSALE